MRDERLKRLDETELLERGRAQIGKDTSVLALQLSDLGLDRARRRAGGRLVANGLRQHRRVCAQGEQMRPELVMQLVRDELSLFVMRVENARHQFIVGAIQTVERLRERVDLRIEVTDLRRSVAFRARGIIAGFKLREGRPGDAQRPHGAPDQKAGHADRGERQQSALQRVLPRFVPDLIDLVRWVGDQDDRVRPAVLHHNWKDSYFGRRAD